MEPIPVNPPVLDEETERRLRPYRLPDGRPMELFLAAAHHPAVLDDLRRATTACLRDLALPVRERELVILRTVARAGAEAEWSLHVHLFAAEAGLSETQVAATRAADWAGWSPSDREVIEFADLCYEADGRVTPQVWRGWQARWPVPVLLGLLTVAGQYRKVALLTNALGLAAPDGLPRFPTEDPRG
jgi:4-carboxymuconolactone decarboxylase